MSYHIYHLKWMCYLMHYHTKALYYHRKPMWYILNFHMDSTDYFMYLPLIFAIRKILHETLWPKAVVLRRDIYTVPYSAWIYLHFAQSFVRDQIFICGPLGLSRSQEVVQSIRDESDLFLNVDPSSCFTIWN